MAAKNKSNEIHIIREYDAPIGAVWNAWTDPKQVAQWWGPRGFTITTHSKDLRAGGNWDYTMHGPDGTDYHNVTKYLEVEEQKKLVYDHGGGHDRPPLFRVTVLFSTIGDKTRMDMTMALPSPEEANKTREFIKQAGGNSTWDRLAEYLERKSSSKEVFVINRSFDVPLELMFEMWTQPEHLSQWLAPQGSSMQFVHADIRSGGSSFFSMSGNGITLHGRVQYLRIEKPNLIVYTQQFADKNGNVSRHPLAPNWPETMLTTVLLTAESVGSTRITVTWEPRGDVTGEEWQVFIKERSGMTRGWTGSFDKLDTYASRNREGDAA